MKKPLHLVFVTDPMCSWCWGMAGEFAKAREILKDRVTFELMLGGINPHGTQPIGDYGRRLMMRLWQQVEATTGQEFGYSLPDEYVHNSTRTCVAIEAFRQISDVPPFEYLELLQQLFFVDAINVTEETVLRKAAENCGVDPEELGRAMQTPAIVERVRFQFNNAQTFGTQVLPNLLIEGEGGALRLFGGGYMDAAMIESQLPN
ncbi:MAG: putative protein-disulfide isomerase [Limisphaerales bacterium]|jgi:putative protein-disulfide isomerase